MATSTSHWEIDGELRFATPSGAALPVHGIDLALDRVDGVLNEARLTFTVSPELYRRIDAEELFNLSRDVRGPGSDRFEPDAEVQVEARLDASLLMGLAAMGDDILETGPRFSSLAEGSLLLESESWYALNVTVEVLRDAEGGVLREGYGTTHASSDRELRLPMLAVAASAIEDRDLDWHETGDEEVIRADITGENGAWACYVVAREREGRCTVYSQAPWETPEARRLEMAELLTRINFGLPVGNFEMDFADGEIRFKTSVDVSGHRLAPELFDNLFEANLATTDVYLPALEAVRDGRLSPKAAVALVEE